MVPVRVFIFTGLCLTAFVWSLVKSEELWQLFLAYCLQGIDYRLFFSDIFLLTVIIYLLEKFALYCSGNSLPITKVFYCSLIGLLDH